VISKSDFTVPIEVEMPDTHGYYVDFVRIGDVLYLLEDNSMRRIVRANTPDLVHCINVEERVFIRSADLPVYRDAEKNRNRYNSIPESTIKFLKIQSELFVVTQTDSDMPVRIISFDVASYQSKLAVLIPPPQPNKDDPASVHTRGFLCAVPPRLMPCEKTSLKELGESFVAPTSV